jgi:hypothetical protein
MRFWRALTMRGCEKALFLWRICVGKRENPRFLALSGSLRRCEA